MINLSRSIDKMNFFLDILSPNTPEIIENTILGNNPTNKTVPITNGDFVSFITYHESAMEYTIDPILEIP